jgi:PBP1b-binding outer membrane lipoprotein LpoB
MLNMKRIVVIAILGVAAVLAGCQSMTAAQQQTKTMNVRIAAGQH